MSNTELSASAVRSFLAEPDSVFAVELADVRGSSPREAGAVMLVSATATLGTIGGGQLEYMAIDKARSLLRSGEDGAELDVPLGPEIGQCCGGRVVVTLKRMDGQRAASLIASAETEDRARPHVYVFGAGHVGQALAAALALLPVKSHVVDTRPETLVGLPAGVEPIATALPEAVVRNAPVGSAFVILTHDHALDFLIAAEALRRADARYVGMVGSATKRARFRTWFKGAGGSEEQFGRLVLPIGAFGIGDKRPAVIAALAAAEIMVHIGRREATELCARPLADREVVLGR